MVSMILVVWVFFLWCSIGLVVDLWVWVLELYICVGSVWYGIFLCILFCCVLWLLFGRFGMWFLCWGILLCLFLCCMFGLCCSVLWFLLLLVMWFWVVFMFVWVDVGLIGFVWLVDWILCVCMYIVLCGVVWFVWVWLFLWWLGCVLGLVCVVDSESCCFCCWLGCCVICVGCWWIVCLNWLFCGLFFWFCVFWCVNGWGWYRIGLVCWLVLWFGWVVLCVWWLVFCLWFVWLRFIFCVCLVCSDCCCGVFVCLGVWCWVWCWVWLLWSMFCCVWWLVVVGSVFFVYCCWIFVLGLVWRCLCEWLMCWIGWCLMCWLCVLLVLFWLFWVWCCCRLGLLWCWVSWFWWVLCGNWLEICLCDCVWVSSCCWSVCRFFWLCFWLCVGCWLDWIVWIVFLGSVNGCVVYNGNMFVVIVVKIISMVVVNRNGIVNFWCLVSLMLVSLMIRNVVGVSGFIGKLVVIWLSSVVCVIWIGGMLSSLLFFVSIGSMLK